MHEKILKEVDTKIEEILETGIQLNNLDSLGKLIDIHKDIKNEEYWKNKEEVMKMNYNRGRYENYGNDSYGRRGVPGSGRGRYGARGNYRGQEMLEDMIYTYQDYSDVKEEYGRGNYGAKEDTLKSLDYMLKSVVQFIQMLQQDADSDEEMQLIRKYTRKISEM